MNAKRIIIVEDDQEIYNVMNLILLSKSYKLISCPTPGRFYEEIGNGKPDLIIMDVMLPDGNGIDLSSETKQNPLFKEVPILLMSAHLDPSVAKSSNADAFMAKPFDIHAFQAIVEHLLNK